MDWGSSPGFWQSLVGVLLGGAITGFFSHRGSRELQTAAQGLRTESERTRALLVVALRALEGAGVVDPLARDEADNITGISHPLSLKIGGKSDLQIKGEVINSTTTIGQSAESHESRA